MLVGLACTNKNNSKRNFVVEATGATATVLTARENQGQSKRKENKGSFGERMSGRTGNKR